MTRSVTIVNTSNWEHEDYVVRSSIQADNPHSIVDATRTPEGARLKAGERLIVHPREGESFSIEAVEDRKAEPFHSPEINASGKLVAKQVIPKVTVTLE